MCVILLQWFLGGEWQTGRCKNAQADVSFSADASDLLMIAARKQNPDTLFFPASAGELKAIRSWSCNNHEKPDGRH